MPGPQYHARTHLPGGTDPIQFPTSVFPTVFAQAGSLATLVDGSYYGMGQLVGTDPSAFGLAGEIEVMNDPADGTGVFNLYNNDRLQVFNGDYIFHVDAGVVFSTTFTGTVTLMMKGTVLSGFQDPVEAHLTDPTATDGNPVLTLNRLFRYTASTYNVATVGATTNLVQAMILQETGSDLDIDAAWFRMTLATTATTTATVTE